MPVLAWHCVLVVILVLAIRLLAAPRIPKRQEVEDENADERLRDDRGHLPVQGSAAILLASDARVCREERC